jgi:F420H(2)-dependent quinone reductase
MGMNRTVQRALTGLHARAFRLTGGRVGAMMGRVEAVLLTTTGRRSGRARTTPLAVTVDGERLVLVASNGGAPRHPDWYLNLVDHPEVTVQRRGESRRYRARTASAEERARLWPMVNATYDGFDGYQRKTDREIPLVVLERLGP